MGRAVYLDQRDARDIRNVDDLLREPNKAAVFNDPNMQRDLWIFFRRMTVKLDKAGNRTKAWKPIRGERRR